jgi:enamine deaminase RidA (YjgF/YER057c/UK114 family)
LRDIVGVEQRFLAGFGSVIYRNDTFEQGKTPSVRPGFFTALRKTGAMLRQPRWSGWPRWLTTMLACVVNMSSLPRRGRNPLKEPTKMIKRIESGPRMSQAVIHQGMVFLAGQVAEDAKQDAAGQTRQVLAAIDRLLAAAGTDKSRLLTATIFLADMADFTAMNSVWDAWVSPGNTPARATVEAQLARPGWLVEIVVTAALP